MKVTVSFLKDQKACKSGMNKFEAIFDKQAELKDVINYGIKSKNKGDLQDCNWLIVRKMTHKQKIQYAIYAAEQVIQIYEKKYPNDDRPRKAIEAAKQILKNNNKKNLANAATYAADASAYAANAAIAANAADAAYAAADAAYAAADAAYAAADAAYAADASAYAANAAIAATYAADAANAAAYAANAAIAAAYAADAAYTAWIKIGTKILEYGLKLIYKK